MAIQRNLLIGGLRLTLQSWPAFVWTYVLNLGLSVLLTLPLRFQMQAITANSLASQRLIGGFDLGTLGGVIGKLSEGPGPATSTSFFSIPAYFILYFFLVPGTLVCYQTGSSARLFPLLESGFTYFWRFVRITLITVLVAGLVMAGLLQLQNLWSDHLDKLQQSRGVFFLGLAGYLVVGLFAAFLRVYFDLVEVYTVQLAQQPQLEGAAHKPGRERQIRRAFKPAWQALRCNFLRTYLSFVLLTIAGLVALIFSARVAEHSLAQAHVWPIFLSIQLGLFLMLFTRFWQRGAETILALDNPLPVPVEPVRAPIFNLDEPTPAPFQSEGAEDTSGTGESEFSI